MIRSVLSLIFALCCLSGVAHAEPEPDGSDAWDEDITHDLEPVVVTGSRTAHRLSDAPVATEVITRDAIENSGAENAAELLEDHSGVQMTRSFRGAGIRLQGLDAKHVLILVNGERLGGRIEGVIDLRRIPVEEIQRIEIVKGPSSALYGSDAMGGVINVVTRESRKPLEGEVHASVGSFTTTDISGRVGLKSDGWNSHLSGGWHHRDAYDLNPANPDTSGSEVSQWNVAQRTQRRLNDKVSILARTSYLRRHMAGVDSNAAGAVFDRRNITEVLTASVGPRIRFKGRPADLRVSGYYTLFRDQFAYDQRGATALDRLEETQEHLAQVSVQYDRLLRSQHFLTIGSEYTYERLKSGRIEGGTGDRYRGALYVQDEWTIRDSPTLVALPGARLDVDSSFGVHGTPKVALRFDPTSDLALRASYGMGFRAPVFKELLLIFENPSVGYVVEGNPELRPETSHSVNLGTEWTASQRASFTLNLFWNEIDNLIFIEKLDEDEVGDSQRFTYLNVDSARTRGLEQQTRLRLPLGFRIDAGYSLTDAQNLTRDRRLAGRALHRGSFDLRYRHQDLGLGFTARGSVVGYRFFYEDTDGDGVDETERADPYATVGLRLSQELGEHGTAFLGVRNLLDAGHEEHLPIQPRTIYGGLTGHL